MRVDQPGVGQFPHLEDAFENGDSTAGGSVTGKASAVAPPTDPTLSDGSTDRVAQPKPEVTSRDESSDSSFQALLDHTLGSTGPAAERVTDAPSGSDVEISEGVAEKNPQSEPIEEMPIGGRHGNDVIQAADVTQLETTVSKSKGPHSDPIETIPIGRL